MRISERRARVWDDSFLVYHYLWQNLEVACEAARRTTPNSQPTLVDVGCGNRPYADLFPGWFYVGINPTAEDATPDVIGDALRLPLTGESADVILCTQVLEHVSRPWVLLSECFRVLKPGGALVLSAPFYWPLHEEPYDYFRYTKYGLESLVRAAGLELLSLVPDGGDGSRIMISLLHYLPRKISVLSRIPLNLLGLLLDKLHFTQKLPQNYTVLARKCEGLAKQGNQ